MLKKRLISMVLMSTNNIYFGLEIRQLIIWYTIITKALIHAIVNWYSPTGLYKVSSKYFFIINYFWAFWQHSHPWPTMPFYMVWNVKLQLYAKGLVWSQGGKHFSKTFSISYMLNSKNSVSNPYFHLLSNKKNIFVDNSRVEPTIFFMDKISFSLKLFSGHVMGNPSIRLSEVLYGI